jgi:hypothetical protein
VVDRSIRWLILLLILAACREPPPDAGREVATGADRADFAAAEPGVEFEAPRLIPGVRARIAELRDPEGGTEANLTAFADGARPLVNAMEADLRRVGAMDTGDFTLLGDSVTRRFGADSLTPDQGRETAAQLERLIALYEERMRQAAH